MKHNHKKLDIWIDGMTLVDDIYNITTSFPKFEIYGLASQMQRAAVSIPSNIAEGAGKGSDKEFAHFLGHALGSLFELETQVLIAIRRQYIAEETNLLENILSLQKRVRVFKDKLAVPDATNEVF